MTSRNLILIVADCLRTDRLGCYGAPRSSAPTIDRLAAEGVLFEQAVAMGFHTLTTMAAVITGCYPSTYGGYASLTSERPRLPSELQTLGYQTAAFAPNPYLSEARGYSLGFDHFDECVPKITPRSTTWQGWTVRGFNRLLKRWGIGIECPPYLNARLLTQRALQWLARVGEPYFLWLHYMDAHTPYNLQRCSLALPGGRGQRPYRYGFWKHLWKETDRVTEEELVLAQHLYESGIQNIDGQIAYLMRALDDLGQLDRTTLMILSDHGEAFKEHGAFGHSNYLYDEIIRIPLIVSPADSTGAGHRVMGQVRQLDLAPTLIELAGGSPPASMEGVSLVPSLRGEDLGESLPAISQTNPKKQWLVSLREPPWKLIWRVDPGTMQSHRIELYHLGEDPEERNDVAALYPDKATAMQNRLAEHIEKLDLQDFAAPTIEGVDPVVLGRLQALGYLDDV